LSDDQRIDDGQSLCFDSAPLNEPLEIFGEPVLELEIESDRPQAHLAVRLCDVAPDGASLRLTYGLLNLSHRDSDENPTPLVPGRRYRLRIPLCATAHSFAPGHRIRLAISSAYWPITWPSPEKARLTLHGAASRLLLPVREPDRRLDEGLAPFAEPEGAEPKSLIETRPRRTTKSQDRLEEEMGEGRATLIRNRDRGAWKTTDTDVEYDVAGHSEFSIQADDPLSAVQDFVLTTTMGRPGWRIRVEARSRQSVTKTDFVLTAEMRAFLNDKEEFARSWDYTIPRDNL
jgi:predicted acyl esterase